MKTAVSIPDEVFQRAERFAKRSKRSRSELVSSALREYLARHAPDEVTEAMDKACREVGRGGSRGGSREGSRGGSREVDPFLTAAARRVLERSEW